MPYFPYSIKGWVNGPEWAKRQATIIGRGYMALSNGFASREDPCPAGFLRPVRARDHRSLLPTLDGPASLLNADAGAGCGWELSVRQIEISCTLAVDAPGPSPNQSSLTTWIWDGRALWIDTVVNSPPDFRGNRRLEQARPLLRADQDFWVESECLPHRLLVRPVGVGSGTLRSQRRAVETGRPSRVAIVWWRLLSAFAANAAPITSRASARLQQHLGAGSLDSGYTVAAWLTAHRPGPARCGCWRTRGAATAPNNSGTVFGQLVTQPPSARGRPRPSSCPLLLVCQTPMPMTVGYHVRCREGATPGVDP